LQLEPPAVPVAKNRRNTSKRREHRDDYREKGLQAARKGRSALCGAEQPLGGTSARRRGACNAYSNGRTRSSSIVPQWCPDETAHDPDKVPLIDLKGPTGLPTIGKSIPAPAVVTLPAPDCVL
jgi:hypothetical protein